MSMDIILVGLVEFIGLALFRKSHGGIPLVLLSLSSKSKVFISESTKGHVPGAWDTIVI